MVASRQTMAHYLQQELYERMRSDPVIFDFLQSAVLDGIWYWNIERPEDEWMSPDFWRLFGYDPAQMPHRPSAWQDIIFPEDRDLAIENFQRHCADPDHPYDQLVRYRHRDGGTVWVRCRGLAIRDDQGRPLRMLGAHQDVSDLVRAQHELQQANERLSAFAHSAAHDLQSPLGTVMQLIDMLPEQASDPGSRDQRQMVELLRAATQRMHATIRGLLDYAQSSKQSVEWEAVDCQALVSQIIDDLNAEISDSSARIDCADLPRLRADSTLLRQCFQNLISNGLKFHPPDRAPCLRISARRTDHGWRFCFADNGIGIPREQLEDIFTPLRRLRARGEFPGTGLGLSSARNAVNALGGHIWAESQPDQGTRFLIDLPDAPPPPAVEVDSAPQPT